MRRGAFVAGGRPRRCNNVGLRKERGGLSVRWENHADASCRYGDEVENYLDVYLRTPGLENKDLARALLARGNARKTASERLLAKAQQDFQAVAKLDPSNRELQGYLRKSNMVRPGYIVSSIYPLSCRFHSALSHWMYAVERSMLGDLSQPVVLT